MRDNGHVLRRVTLDLEVEGQKTKGRPKRTWKRQVEEESMKVGFRREIHFSDQSVFLALIRLLLDRGEYGLPRMLGALPDLKHW